ncbi:hypothetical protein O181_023402 [Austropuccinia psidii MF-1]|uniref:Uncharacterized protein n=1 Tax=Austropuccinia psidii MF-1 TaxID=1389203 RepID=A0A9Q3GY02_9BASI|nr:hypothetical protein [Austropuccinia psidii MF-1]
MWQIRRLQLQALGQTQILLSLKFPQFPLIHKCMCLRGQEAHLKSHQRLIPNQNFHMSSSSILVGIQLCPRNPLGKVNSQPSIFHWDIRFLWELKSVSMGGNKKHHCKMLLGVIWHLKEGDEIYTSFPVVNKEKVTGHHHQYASKPSTAHASSSREKIVDYEDENMSRNHSETNDKLRRDNFAGHEEGT